MRKMCTWKVTKIKIIKKNYKKIIKKIQNEMENYFKKISKNTKNPKRKIKRRKKDGPLLGWKKVKHKFAIVHSKLYIRDQT